MRRLKRRGEAGLSLIELLISISIMAIAFVALAAGFAQSELLVGSSADDAQLASLARQVADLTQSEGFAYVACTGPAGQAPSGKTTYQTALRAAVSTTYTINVVGVMQADASSQHTVSGTTGPLTAINNCVGAGTGSSADYGVQRITFAVVAPSGRSLQRVVFKRWN